LGETGDLVKAKSEAERALVLDALNPHQEQKLAQRRLFDPEPDAESPTRSESAEESIRGLIRQGTLR
jgi:hypothetical protein